MPLSPGRAPLHRAGRGFLGVEHADRLLRGLFGVPLGALAFEVTERGATAAARRAFLAPPVLLADHPHPETNQGLRVARALAVPGDDQDLAVSLRRGSPPPSPPGIVGRARRPRRARGAFASRSRGVEGDLLQLVALPDLDDRRRDRSGGSSTGGDLRRGLGGAFHRVPIELLDVGVAGRVPFLDPDAEAQVEPRGRRFSGCLRRASARRQAVFEKEIRVVAPPASAMARSRPASSASTAAGPSDAKGRAVQAGVGGHALASVKRSGWRVERMRGAQGTGEAGNSALSYFSRG